MILGTHAALSDPARPDKRLPEPLRWKGVCDRLRRSAAGANLAGV